MDTPNYRMPFVPSTLMTEGEVSIPVIWGKYCPQYHAPDHY